MKTNWLMIIMIALTLTLSVSVFAQEESAPGTSPAPYFTQDPGDGGGGDGGGSGPCYECLLAQNGWGDGTNQRAVCVNLRTLDVLTPVHQDGYTGCTAHNALVGPVSCTMSGAVCRVDYDVPPYWIGHDPGVTLKTLTRLIGLDATAMLLFEISGKTQGMDELAQFTETSRLLEERLMAESKARGYGDGYLVIPDRLMPPGS